MKKIVVKISKTNSKVGYLYLPNHPGSGIPGAVHNQLDLSTLISSYKEPLIYLDFAEDGELIGIEILD